MRTTFIIGLLALVPRLSHGQQGFTNKVEFGIWGGTASYVGDIRPAYKEQIKLVRPAFGVYNRLNFDRRWAIRTSLNYGTITSSDHYSTNVYEQMRNLSFTNTIMEAATQLEFNFKKYVMGSSRYDFTPYTFLGIGIFLHNPKAELDGKWYDLQPLGTEGQFYPSETGLTQYKLFQVAVPMGGGFKWSVNKHLTLGFEVGYRATYTDYLDDISGEYYSTEVLATGPNGAIVAALADRSSEVVSIPIGEEGRQRGDSRSTDAYVFTGISISYTFRRFVCPWPQF